MGRKMCPKKNAKKHGKNHPSRQARTAWSKQLEHLQKQCGGREEKAIQRKESTHISFHEPTVVARGRLRSHVLINRGRGRQKAHPLPKRPDWR